MARIGGLEFSPAVGTLSRYGFLAAFWHTTGPLGCFIAVARYEDLGYCLILAHYSPTGYWEVLAR